MQENKGVDSSKQHQRVSRYIRKGDEIIDITYDGVSEPPFKSYSALNALEGGLAVSNDNENFIVRYYSDSKRTGVVYAEFLKDHSLKCMGVNAFHMGMKYARRKIRRTCIGKEFKLIGLGRCILADTCKDNVHVILENNGRGYKVKLRDILDGRTPYHIWKEAEDKGYFQDMNENKFSKDVNNDEKTTDEKFELISLLTAYLEEKDNKIKYLEQFLKEIFELKCRLNESNKTVEKLKDTVKRKDEELTILRGVVVNDLQKTITNVVEARLTYDKSGKSKDTVKDNTEDNCVKNKEPKKKVRKKYTKPEFKDKVVCGRKCKENEFLDLTYANLKKPEFSSFNCYEALQGKLCKSVDGELFRVRYIAGNSKGLVFVEFLKDHSMKCMLRQAFPYGVTYGY